MQGAWRAFWDQQLLRVLDAQLARDLRALYADVPMQRIALTFADRALRFQPPIEELRARFYREHLDALLGVPGAVQGFAPGHERRGGAFFAAALAGNATAVAGAYTHAEGVLFAGLRKLQARYAPWAAVGQLEDVHAFVAGRVTDDVTSLEREFDALKAAAREQARAVPAEAREACFLVDLLPLRAGLAEHTRRLRDAIAAAGHASAVRDRDALAAFVAEGRALLAQEAGSLSEIGEARMQVHPSRHLASLPSLCRPQHAWQRTSMQEILSAAGIVPAPAHVLAGVSVRASGCRRSVSWSRCLRCARGASTSTPRTPSCVPWRASAWGTRPTPCPRHRRPPRSWPAAPRSGARCWTAWRRLRRDWIGRRRS